MRHLDETRYDFRTGTWVRDDFLSPPSQGEWPDPKTPPAMGRWNAPVSPACGALQKFREAGPRVQVLTLAAALASVLVALRFGLVPGLVGSYVTLLFSAGQLSITPPISARDRRLLEDPDDPDVCLVDLLVWRAGREVGRDRGVAWFEEGRLLFNGHRTSFAFGGEDVLPRSRWGAFALPDGTTSLPGLGVPLRLTHDRAYILLTPVPGKGDTAQRQEMAFLRGLYDFRLRPPQSQGTRQWPPFDT